MQINKNEIKDILRSRLENYLGKVSLENEGKIVSISDGIVTISGLSASKYGEVIYLGEKKQKAFVMNLERNSVSAILFDNDSSSLKEGTIVKTSGEVLKVPVGRSLLGRVVDALGNPIDNLGALNAERFDPIEKESPLVMDRHPVTSPLMTGYKAIDVMVPIGKGQRELIIGDRQTGKTTLALDIIVNQSKKGVKCFYVAIGQKASTIVEFAERLKAVDAMQNTTIIIAHASHSASMQYIAPYSGSTMAEYFRDMGEDAIIIYDDLSKHAVAYREISLLLKRPPGREAYPGDVFYLHSRLLERSSCVNIDYLKRVSPGVKFPKEYGSLTAFPIVETQSGDFSGFVSTNVVSITDGQIFLDASMFNAGIRPAVSPGISVSRIGGAAQYPILKKLSGGLRTDLAQFIELQAFSQFASDLEDSSREKLELGKKITNILKQPAYAPLSAAEQSVLLLAIRHPVFSSVSESNLIEFEKSLLNFMHLHYISLMTSLENEISSNNIKELISLVNVALSEFSNLMT